MDRFFIAPYDTKSGLRTDLKPWLIPDEAFSTLQNAYVFRGRVRKRFGSTWFGFSSLSSRFAISMGVTTGGTLAGNVRTINVDSSMPTAIGQSFSVGGIIFTVYNPAPGPQQMYRSDGLVATATYDLTTSDFDITGVVVPNGTTVFFYPGFPVMGLLTYDNNSLQNEMTIGFDTRYAYGYVAGIGWGRLSNETNAGDAVWTGSNSQFFWGATYRGDDPSDQVFWVTNFNNAEPNFMRYFFSNTWTQFDPAIDASNFIFSARIVIPFRNTLLFMNTWEGTSAGAALNYTNRVRWSTPNATPLGTDAWRQDLPGNGNALDAPTTEAIVSAGFVKDRLIVSFEESTWELAYTGNVGYPFAWYQLNTELGAESPFSGINFDRVRLAVGNVGIHSCNGQNVERIDDSIPDEVFGIHNADDGIFRVYGIRDYFVEMAYWTFPDTEDNSDFPFPNRVLVYNYKKGTWSINDDTITVFGYFQPQTGDDVTWDSTTITWDDATPWDSGDLQTLFRQVVAGNQQGYTFIIDADVPTNAAVLQITDIPNTYTSPNVIAITSIDHNLREGDYFYLIGITGTGNLNLLNDRIFQVLDDGSLTPNSFSFIYSDSAGNIISGTYSGAGLIGRVSNINIVTKEYNFYADKGRNALVNRIDFMVDNNPIFDDEGNIIGGSQLNANYYASTNVINLRDEGVSNNTLLGNGTLDAFAYPSIPFEEDASRLWRPIYCQAEGEVVQFQLTMSSEQVMTVFDNTTGEDPSFSFTGPALVDFQLHSMIIYAMPTSDRLR